MPSQRASLRWPGSPTFRRLKTDRVLTSSRTEMDSARKRVRGSRWPTVCEVGAAEVEA